MAIARKHCGDEWQGGRVSVRGAFVDSIDDQLGELASRHFVGNLTPFFAFFRSFPLCVGAYSYGSKTHRVLSRYLPLKWTRPYPEKK